ncbi:MAG TPA: transglycosylase domain-containing protein [Ferruginibacter sp.]|nr:peptidoglycan glycosyltransferase [Chitinophagaceae bacterium]HRI25137.1 transglycosylase domain-containing protein [Ferruginibacter sp.]
MKRSIQILWRVFFSGFLFVLLMFLCANFGLFGKMPSVTQLQNPEADLASEIYSGDGELMGKYYSENRSEVKYSEISPNVINALIATEDERFYEHSGIDAEAVARALFTLGSGGGGSTITQQVAKMMLKQGKGNIIKRVLDKMKEWIVAVKLERNFTKEEIITLYLNRAPWGNVYGIRNASRTYFQKEPKDLKIEEAAVLVGMLKGFIYNPITRQAASINRRNIVINQMVVCKQHFLTPEQGEKLKAKPLITYFKKIDENVGIAPYFRAVLADKLKEWCKTHENPKTGEPYNLYRDGLRIYTTINSRMQQYAEEAVVQHMPVIQKKLDQIMKANGDKMWKGHENTIEAAFRYTERWKNMKEEDIKEEDIKKSFYVPVKMKVFAWNAKREKDTVMTPFDSIKYHKNILQTSFAAMDPKTGEVKCWVGGIDFKWFKFDHITTKRQVGSTIKPLIYSLAVEDAGYNANTEIPGGLVQYGKEMRTFSGGGGPMGICLAKSRNTASVRLTNLVGVKRVIEFAKECGIKSQLPPYISLALGSAEVPMLEMLQSYSMFPNNSYNIEPILLTRIEDKNGNVLAQFTAETKQVMSEASAYTMVKMMQGVVQFGTAHSLNNYNIPVQKAGKTGTTNDNADGWFIGYTPELLAGTWVGCEDPFIRIYAGTSGGNELALPKWGLFMSKVYADGKLGYGKIKEFPVPANLKNDILSADNEWEVMIANDSAKDDVGNGTESDYQFNPSQATTNIGIESEIPRTDTGKSKKPDDKKGNNVPAPAAADDKSKKPVTKPKTGNDY